MARTKNRGLQQSFSPSYTVRRWRLGEYIRLSKEDLKKGKDDSNSVINQRDLLNDFYQKHIGEFESVSEYVDDGHTGTDANRENFQRLLSDVMSGKINCVVVKDLSRFARNYSDAGSLIDNLFVQMGVRFISLAENVDSYLNPDSVSSIIVPITNVMNDQYCYQTSKKIRQVFDYKRRNGQYIGAFAPYGYVKHPKDKHQLIIDPDAAEIVKLVFSLFLKGTSKRAIALYLNEHGVPSPSAYKLQKGIPDDQQLEAYKELCRYYYDTRMFGLVNTSYSNCSLLSRIKGACQVSMPMSYDPIEIIPMTITRCCVASDAERKGEDKGAKKGVSIDESDDGAEKKTKDRMIGRRSIIRYGLYHMSIQINSAMAQRNGVTMDDVNLLIDALQHMFEEDMSSSRALTLRKLFVVEHTKPMGNAYRDTIERALAARLKQPNDAPTSYEDYEVTYHREMLPDEVKVTEYNYNSQSV